MENNVFEKLNSINVNDKTENKNGLTYLSWAWAWGELKKVCPNAQYKVYETENGCNYFNDGRTAWVKTSVTVDGLEYVDYLPIMDYKNKSMPLENITSFDVNKTIQRSITKAIARHGLGLYIYAGEDLPEDENGATTNKVPVAPKEPPFTREQVDELIGFGFTLDQVATRLKKDKSKLTFNDLEKVLDKIKAVKK